jgi:hypothetical protein
MPNASRVVDKPPEGSVTQYYLEFWKIELVLRPLDRNMFQLTTVNLQTFSSNPSHRTPRPLRQGRVVSRNIDVALPKQWLRTCESIHPVIGSAYLKGVRVIEVERECLVTVVDSCRYITLSYVWGIQQTFALRRASREAFECPGGLSPRNPLLPRTLRDAILLTKSLNEQYL